MKIKLILIAGMVFVLLSIGFGGYKYFSKNFEIINKEEKVLGEQVKETLDISSPSMSPIVTSPPAPKYRQPTPLPMGTTTPTPQKILVYLPHNNQSVYCDPTSASAVESASKNIQQIETNNQDQGSEMILSAQKCTNDCMSKKSTATGACFQDPYPFSLNECLQIALDSASNCLDVCKATHTNEVWGIVSVNYDTFNSLISKYCQ